MERSFTQSVGHEEKKGCALKKWWWENLKVTEGDTAIFPLVLLFSLHTPRTKKTEVLTVLPNSSFQCQYCVQISCTTSMDVQF